MLENEKTFADLDRVVNVPFIFEAGLQDDRSDVFNLGNELQPGDEFHQLSVRGVIIPTQDRQAVFRLELVAVRRVVNDDDVFHGAAHSCHIFDELVVEEGAVFTEKSLRGYSFGV